MPPSPGRLKAVPHPKTDLKSPMIPPPQPGLGGSLVRPPRPLRISPQPAHEPHGLPQPTRMGKMIPSLVVTVLELHFEFVAETVSYEEGGDVIVVEIGTLVVTVDPRLLVPTMARRKGTDEVPEEVVIALVVEAWEAVDEAEKVKVCPGEAVVDSFELEDDELDDVLDVDEVPVDPEAVPSGYGCELLLLDEVPDERVLLEVVNDVVPPVLPVGKFFPVEDPFEYVYDVEVNDDREQFPMLLKEEEPVLRKPLELLLEVDSPEAHGSVEVVPELAVVPEAASWRAFILAYRPAVEGRVNGG